MTGETYDRTAEIVATEPAEADDVTMGQSKCVSCGEWQQKMIYSGKDSSWYCEAHYPYEEPRRAGGFTGFGPGRR